MSRITDALLDFFVVDESNELEEVNLAEDVLEDESKVRLGLDRAD